MESSVMNKKDFEQQMQDIAHKMSLENRDGDLRRARSIAVGTAFGGVTEIMMRGNDGNVLWSHMQPVEVIELIHQLAANVGCHIHIQPREDFSSWRGWSTETKKIQPNEGVATLENKENFQKIGQDASTKQINGAIKPQETENGQIMATKKAVKRRTPKRRTKTSG